MPLIRPFGYEQMKLKAHQITLQENRIVLRPMTEEDWGILLKWNSDPEVLYYSEGNHVNAYSLEDIQGIYRGVSQCGFCFIIELDGNAIGECWLQEMNLERILQRYPGQDCRRIDLMIGEKALWGQGIGTEVIRLLTAFAFQQEGADFVLGCGVGDYNPRSRRAFQKNGFRIDARIPQAPEMKAGCCYDLILARDETERDHPLDQEGCRELARALGETPETLISLHFLRQGNCRAFVVGDPARFDGAIIQSIEWPTEPVGFGSDPHVLWDLLRSVQGWDCILVDSDCARTLGGMMAHEMGLRVRYLDDVGHELSQPVAAFHDPAVRLLAPDDIELLQAAPLELRASCWDSLESLLYNGVIACAIVAGEIVATALTAARGERYADVGVFTRPDFRGRGYATAAASLVAGCVQRAGQVPIWGAGEHNTASLQVARKLGFVQVSRRTYVIPIKSEP